MTSRHRFFEKNVAYPTARLTMEYGLDHDGDPIVLERWENLADTDSPVPMVIKTGLLAMAQQSQTAQALGLNVEAADDELE